IEREVVWGISPLFDFEKGEFVFSKGRMILGNETQTLIQSIRKALIVERYRWRAYTRQYGNELLEKIGKGFHENVLKSLVEKYIKEALIADNRIRLVSNFDIAIQGDTVIVTFNVLAKNNFRTQLEVSWVIQ